MNSYFSKEYIKVNVKNISSDNTASRMRNSFYVFYENTAIAWVSVHLALQLHTFFSECIRVLLLKAFESQIILLKRLIS